MKYASLAMAVLTMLFMLAAPAYATDHIVLDPLAGDTTDVPDWALKPAEDPDAPVDDPPVSVTPIEPVTVTDGSGNVIYQEDENGVELTPDLYAVDADAGLFLYKPFEEYTVTEGFLLLFLILGFCLVIWKMIKGVL